jgi:hypothetical protein
MPTLQVKLRKSYERKAGYARYSGVGQLTRPVENQEGQWYVKFKNIGETFLSVGRHGVHELAYVDMGTMNMLSSNKRKIQDLGEPEKVEDEVSVSPAPRSPGPTLSLKVVMMLSIMCILLPIALHWLAVCDCTASTVWSDGQITRVRACACVCARELAGARIDRFPNQLDPCSLDRGECVNAREGVG